ncbi:hypothetical protein [Bacillus thuringiensis]|nr:hypothetical protein [Bacillus thuringiensis]
MNGNFKRSIAHQLGLNRRTISKYLNPKTTGVHASLGQTKMSMLNPYAEEIKQYVINRYHSSRERLQKLCLYCAQLYFQTEKIFI